MRLLLLEGRFEPRFSCCRCAEPHPYASELLDDPATPKTKVSLLIERISVANGLEAYSRGVVAANLWISLDLKALCAVSLGS
jgi:hypothetical protein